MGERKRKDLLFVFVFLSPPFLLFFFFFFLPIQTIHRLIRTFDVDSPIPPLSQTHWTAISLVFLLMIAKYVPVSSSSSSSSSAPPPSLFSSSFANLKVDNVMGLAGEIGIGKDEVNAWATMFTP